MAATYLLRSNLLNDPSLWPAGRCMVWGTQLLSLNSLLCSISAANLFPGKTGWSTIHLPEIGSLCTDFPPKGKFVHHRSYFSVFPENCKLSMKGDHTRLPILTTCKRASAKGHLKISVIQWSAAVHPDDICYLDGFIIFEPDRLVNIRRRIPSMRACHMVCLRIILCAYDYNVEISTSLLSCFI